MDIKLLFLINRQWTNPVLDWVTAIFSNASLWMPFLAIVAVILLWKGDFRVRSFVLVTLCAVGITDGVFTQSMKRLIHRPRPHEALAEVREVSLQNAKPEILAIFRPLRIALSKPPSAQVEGRSFPSGHTMNNSIVATLAILFFGRLGALYIIPAAIVSYSRIYCGVHWPSDVFVSAILGIGFALLIAGIAAILYRSITRRFWPHFYTAHPSLVSSSTS
jgi:undecaprenyl-diphosphatase